MMIQGNASLDAMVPVCASALCGLCYSANATLPTAGDAHRQAGECPRTSSESTGVHLSLTVSGSCMAKLKAQPGRTVPCKT